MDVSSRCTLLDLEEVVCRPLEYKMPDNGHILICGFGQQSCTLHSSLLEDLRELTAGDSGSGDEALRDMRAMHETEMDDEEGNHHGGEGSSDDSEPEFVYERPMRHAAQAGIRRIQEFMHRHPDFADDDTDEEFDADPASIDFTKYDGRIRRGAASTSKWPQVVDGRGRVLGEIQMFGGIVSILRAKAVCFNTKHCGTCSRMRNWRMAQSEHPQQLERILAHWICSGHKYGSTDQHHAAPRY